MPTKTKNNLTLREVLAVCPGPAERRGKKYLATCPKCHQPLVVEEKQGKVLVLCNNCPEGEAWARIVELTDARRVKKQEAKETPPAGLTLERYSEMTHLPLPWLSDFYVMGNLTWQPMNIPAVVIPYIECLPDGRPGEIKGFKYRLSESHDVKLFQAWDRYKGPYPYGVLQSKWAVMIEERLGRALGCEVPDPPVGYGLVLVEGESDQQTLLFNGILSVGIPGKNGWQPEFAEVPLIKDAGDILIVQEPDAEGFPEEIAESFPKGHRVFAVKLPVKDPRALWIGCGYNPNDGVESYTKAHEEFMKVWSEALAKARELRDGYEFTDLGNTERLVGTFGDRFRWLKDADTFYIWNDRVWEKSLTGDNLLPWTKETVRAIPDEDWRLTSSSAGKARAMITLSKGESQIHAKRENFDRQPMLLNVANGTVELENQTLREHRREDYMSKCAPVSFDLFAECPKFDAFLDLIFGGDKDLIHYVVKTLGYSLTGDISEQVYHICLGEGRNGKSTLLELMRMLMGPDYATAAKFSTFVVSRYPDANSYDLATLEGARLVTAAEPNKSQELDEAILKQITGGDLLKARQIYEHPIQFHPECKLWLLMNSKPRLSGTDEGTWRRVRLIPFNVQIPKPGIPDFHKVLFAEEGPGILNRLLEGVRDWMAERLVPPPAIADATAEFRESQDVLKGFFAEHTNTGRKDMKARAGALYDRYLMWCKKNNEHPMRQNEFAEELRRRGFNRQTGGGNVVYYYGLELTR